MEYCEGGDISTVIKRCKSCGGLVMEAFVWHVLYQTARALQACHWHVAATILHRDIKPANVFLDCCYNIKLGDFGLARVLEHTYGTAHTLVGTPSYMSPEVMRGSKYNKMSDMWALGCLVYELCALAPPFNGNNMRNLARKIVDGRFERIPTYYSEDLQNIITLLLNVDQEKRPAVEDILQHPIVVSQVAANKFASLDFKSAGGGVSGAKCAAMPEPVVTAVERPTDDCAGDANTHLCREMWLNRMESLKQRESALRAREVALVEREREAEKREKRAAMLDRLAREKVARADVYLHQCRGARSLASSVRGPQPRTSFAEEDLDSSFSADPGDASADDAAGRLPFARSASERRVHFTLPAARAKRWDAGSASAELENVENRILSMMNVNMPTIEENSRLNSVESLRPAPKNGAWLGKKKQVFHSIRDSTMKENVSTCTNRQDNSQRLQSLIPNTFVTSAQNKTAFVSSLRW
ncbi:serine/threonine-protein kinase Nek2-like isoform X2 [Bacillus rossius redtenbacheri]